MDNELIKAKILYSLARKRKWGESHTAWENLFRVFKSEAAGKDIMRQAKEAADELYRQGFILKKPTGYGLQVSLNPNFSHNVKVIIKENLGIDL